MNSSSVLSHDPQSLCKRGKVGVTFMNIGSYDIMNMSAEMIVRCLRRTDRPLLRPIGPTTAASRPALWWEATMCG